MPLLFVFLCTSETVSEIELCICILIDILVLGA